MKKSTLLFEKLIDHRSFDHDQREFISLLFTKKKSIAWCSNALTAPFTLGEELAEENGVEISYNSTIQIGSGLYSPKEKVTLFMNPAFSDNYNFMDYIQGGVFHLYQESAKQILIDIVAKNIQFAIVFNTEGMLNSILEVSCSGERIYFHPLFLRRSTMEHTGVLPRDADLRISSWRPKTAETPRLASIADSVLDIFPIIVQDLIKGDCTQGLEIHEAGDVYFKQKGEFFKHEEKIQTSDFAFLVKTLAQRNGQKVAPPQILNIKPGVSGFDINIIVSQNGDSRIIMHKT